MEYVGEHLLPGQIGHFFILVSLIASLTAAFAYFKAVQATPDAKAGWLKLARISFFTEVFAVLVIFAALLHILYYHLFEYKYAWQHTSLSLEFKYIMSAFWEGQEGSTLLWTFWHCVLGVIIIRREKQWEAPVMSVVSFAQFFLATMIIGIYVFDVKIGSNPFILLRDSGVLDEAAGMHVNFDVTQPIRADYLTMITDGNDLNPLLQNYWMVIHPPILFLGFASTLIPFAFAMAGLWTRDIKGWVTRAIPWTLFSVAFLGLGIMMGAKWAYESLNFGGYWAWDPVENASLVPWMIMVSGLHTMLIFKHSGYSLRSSFLFLALSFIFIVYSTFLTKSGVLGDSSVHAFADIGMNGQLFLFLIVFVWLPPFFAAQTNKHRLIITGVTLILSLATYFLAEKIPGFPLYVILAGIATYIVLMNKLVPSVKKEESVSSREFWMFIGSLVFFLAAMIIIFQTSLPVFNKLFNSNKAPGENDEFNYNKIQVLIAFVIGILTAITQYLKYKSTDTKSFLNKMLVPTIISAVVATFILIVVKINYDVHGMGFLINIWLALVATVYATIANAAYIWVGLKGKLKNSGGSVAHFGFGLMLVGMILSSSKKEILSWNTSGIAVPFGEDSKEKTGENLTLVKGVPMQMNDYMVTYVGDSAHPKKEQTYFKVHFKSKTSNEEFTLLPDAFVNYKGNEGLMANPSSKHYWNHDVFTYVSSFYKPTAEGDTISFKPNSININDTIFYSKGFITIEKLAAKDNLPVAGFSKSDTGYTASVKVQELNGSSYSSDLLLIRNAGKTLYQTQDTIMAQSLVLRLEDAGANSVTIGVKESNDVLEYLTLKAYKFPYINLVWAGVIFLVIGSVVAMVRRVRLLKLKAA
ncbi:cytochrome c biogenesis protein CcsA [Niabella ginsengisoli]|uniref:Cytochrome c biogenesis protein CcsA n=1 Tax=Niabella ginsengisoli TaxID=522298 RepID=A0ABS9SLK8_9BACT|nr:cytochrome c biogenesis protein CcsA [Niabella ginsengisoli]MCH5599044.1 cytochrome c biogenesis protein CcsA [Niabella ginsengisoli]